MHAEQDQTCPPDGVVGVDRVHGEFRSVEQVGCNGELADGDDEHCGVPDPEPGGRGRQHPIDWLEQREQGRGHDDVQDDTEDARIRRLAVDDATSDSFGMTTDGEDDDDPEEDGQ